VRFAVQVGLAGHGDFLITKTQRLKKLRHVQSHVLGTLFLKRVLVPVETDSLRISFLCFLDVREDNRGRFLMC